MIESTKLKVSDGNDELIWTNAFIIYGDTLIIENLIPGWKILFTFNDSTESSEIESKGNNENKTINVELNGFNKPFGVLGTAKTVIWETNTNGRVISFSIKAQATTQEAGSTIRDIVLSFFLSPEIKSLETIKPIENN